MSEFFYRLPLYVLRRDPDRIVFHRPMRDRIRQALGSLLLGYVSGLPLILGPRSLDPIMVAYAILWLVVMYEPVHGIVPLRVSLDWAHHTYEVVFGIPPLAQIRYGETSDITSIYVREYPWRGRDGCLYSVMLSWRDGRRATRLAHSSCREDAVAMACELSRRLRLFNDGVCLAKKGWER